MPGYAAIDCGTNSTRLLAVDEDGNVIARDYVVTRLGQGVDATGVLKAEAIERTLAAIRKFKTVLENHKIQSISVFATSAARDAANSEDFFSAAERILGQRPVLLSGVEEGQMTFAGASHAVNARSLVVIDIGGGSTELVVGPKAISAISVDIGAVRITERFFKTDPFASEEIATATEFIDRTIEAALDDLSISEPLEEAVAVAGTATALAMMDLGLETYTPGCVQGHELPRQSLNSLTKNLLGWSQEQRLATSTIEPARADVLPAGALILERIVQKLHLDICLISETDNLDGAVRQLQAFS